MNDAIIKRSLNFRRLGYDNGLLGYIEYEFELADWSYDGIVRVLDELAGTDEGDSAQVSLRNRNDAIDTLLDAIKADQTNTNTIVLLGSAISWMTGVFGLGLFGSSYVVLATALLAASLIIILFVFLRMFRASRIQKTQDALLLVKMQTEAQIRRLDHTEIESSPKINGN